MEIGYYKITGSTQKDSRKYLIFGEVITVEKESKIKIEIMENKIRMYPVGSFAMRWTGVSGFGSEYFETKKTDFVGWKVDASKLDKFFDAFSATIKEKYKSFRLYLYPKEVKNLKVLGKI